MKYKDVSARLAEMVSVYEQVRQLGLPEDLPALRTFRALAQDFVRDGTSASGTLLVPELQKTLCYRLAAREGVASEVLLRERR